MAEIAIKRLARSIAYIQVEGTAPLIVNRFSEKARQMMEDKQQGRANIREPKQPEVLYEAAAYRLEDGTYGFPAAGFKGALVGAVRYFKGSKLTMTALKQMIFVRGEGEDQLVRIEAPEPKMRTDTVRNATGVADIRYRPMFWPWRASVPVEFIQGQFTIDSLIALLDASGLGGIGEWRPSAPKSMTGMFGTYAVVADQDVKEITL